MATINRPPDRPSALEKLLQPIATVVGAGVGALTAGPAGAVAGAKTGAAIGGTAGGVGAAIIGSGRNDGAMTVPGPSNAMSRRMQSQEPDRLRKLMEAGESLFVLNAPERRQYAKPILQAIQLEGKTRRGLA